MERGRLRVGSLPGDYRGIGPGTALARGAARLDFVLEPPQPLPVLRDVRLLQPAQTPYAGTPYRVDVPGGTLSVTWTEDDRVLMTGPAEIVAEGVTDL